MNIWVLVEWATWIGSALLLLWILVDALRVNREYDEDILLSSREGYDEMIEVTGHTRQEG